MDTFSMQNPVFSVFAIAASIAALKVMGQGWMTVYRMLKIGSGWASPEDLQKGLINRSPKPSQLEPNEYVDRSRRLHRNDLENIPAFWIAGLLFVTVDPPLWLAQSLYFGFVGTRAFHFLAYVTKQSHELRALFYTIGSVIVIYMASHVFIIALFAM